MKKLLLLSLLCLVGRGEDVCTSIKANCVLNSQMGPGNVQAVDVNLTASQIDTLNQIPQGLIAAPGTGKAIAVDSVYCFNDFGTVAYGAGTATLDVRYGSSTGFLAVSLPNSFVEAADDQLYVAKGGSAVVVSGASVVLAIETDPATGDGALNCRAHYRVIQTDDI